MSAPKPVLFSGIQPTGRGTMLGNYIGAIRNWLNLQDSYDCLFCIVDLHGITVRTEPKQINDVSYLNLATYIAAGIKPESTLMFVQSSVPAHAELAWILTCNTWMGELSRMTQFKDKSMKGENVGTGLFTYPVLMAADILLYQTKLVPVGQDQKQHLELTRDLAIRMNNAFGPLFTVPEVFIPPVGAKIMSLQNPEIKMSKSDENQHATVFFSDSEDEIVKKFKRAVTDSKNEINYSDEQPGLKNLIDIQAVLTNRDPKQIAASYAGKGYGQLKMETAEIVNEHWRPVKKRAQELLADKSYLNAILRQGADKATARAETTLSKVKAALGFIVP